MSRLARRIICFAICIISINFSAAFVWAVSPNPLQSAYWRFEEGTANNFVDASGHDPVPDSINHNNLEAFNSSSAPLYTSTVAPTPLKSGLTNKVAMDFAPNNDLFTLYGDNNLGRGGVGKPINNGTIANGGGFTLEAAFRPGNLGFYQAIVAKEGQPAKGDGSANSPLPTLALKIRGDNNNLQFEQFDGAAQLVSVSSLNPMVKDNWYYAAVVNNGSQMSLYLDSNDGNGYQLQGSTAVNNALYQGPNGYGPTAAPDWSNSWTVGRGQNDGAPADFYQGIIDEVRLSNTALAPSDFLFASATTGIAGDFNHNGIVDAADYVAWRKGLGTIYTQNDYSVWRAHFGQSAGSGAGTYASSDIPEPATLVLLLFAVAGGILQRRRTA